VSTATADWVSVASAALLVSMLVPAGWEAQPIDETRLTLLRDAADDNGYRASVTVLAGEPEQEGAAWFDAFCDAAPGQLAASLDDYEEIDRDTFKISSRARVLQISYRQHAEGAPPTSNLQAYLWLSSYRMYVVSASTLREHEDRDLPVFARIVKEMRLLPERR
jgi:hypothetical protein